MCHTIKYWDERVPSVVERGALVLGSTGVHVSAPRVDQESHTSRGIERCGFDQQRPSTR